MSFVNGETITFAYLLMEHAKSSLKTMTSVEIALSSTTTATEMGVFSSLSGYMTLGLGPKAEPSS